MTIMIVLVSSMKGYLNNTEATAEFFTDDGFAAMGDLGYFDEEGKLFFKERMKDVLKVGSEKNYSLTTANSILIPAIISGKTYMVWNIRIGGCY